MRKEIAVGRQVPKAPNRRIESRLHFVNWSKPCDDSLHRGEPRPQSVVICDFLLSPYAERPKEAASPLLQVGECHDKTTNRDSPSVVYLLDLRNRSCYAPTVVNVNIDRAVSLFGHADT